MCDDDKYLRHRDAARVALVSDGTFLKWDHTYEVYLPEILLQSCSDISGRCTDCTYSVKQSSKLRKNGLLLLLPDKGFSSLFFELSRLLKRWLSRKNELNNNGECLSAI